MQGGELLVLNQKVFFFFFSFPSKNSSGSISGCLGYVSVKMTANFSFAVQWPALMEDLVRD